MPLVHANQSRHIQQLFELKLPLQSNWFIWSTVEFSTQTSYVGRNPCALPPLHKYRKVMTLWEKQFSNMFSPGDGLLPKLRILLLQLSSVSVLPPGVWSPEKPSGWTFSNSKQVILQLRNSSETEIIDSRGIFFVCVSDGYHWMLGDIYWLAKHFSVGNGDGYCAKEVAFGHLKDVKYD